VTFLAENLSYEELGSINFKVKDLWEWYRQSFNPDNVEELRSPKRTMLERPREFKNFNIEYTLEPVEDEEVEFMFHVPSKLSTKAKVKF
jgi:hypothetical protein